MDHLIKSGRYLFAIPFIVFGVQHFIYAEFTAGIVPSYIPGHLFWVYFVGAAMIAAGACILLKYKSQLAATLIGIMLIVFILLIHVPLLAGNVYNGGAWTNAMKDLAIAGGAFVVAGIGKR